MWRCGQCGYREGEEQDLKFVMFENAEEDFVLCPQCGAVYWNPFDGGGDKEVVLEKLAPRRVRRMFKKMIAEKKGG